MIQRPARSLSDPPRGRAVVTDYQAIDKRNAELNAEICRWEQEAADHPGTHKRKIRLDDAKRAFLEANSGLARAASKKYARVSRSPGDREEFEAAAILGLMEARKKWTPAQGSFAAYSKLLMHRHLVNQLHQKSGLTISSTDFEKRPKVRDAEERLTKELGRRPTNEEVAAEAKEPLPLVQRVRAAERDLLDEPTHRGDTSLMDAVMAPSAGGAGRRMIIDRVIKEFDEIDTQTLVKAAVHLRITRAALGATTALSARELLVFARYTGLDGATPETFNEIGAWTGFGRETARKLQLSASAKFRRDLRKILKSGDNQLLRD